MKKNNIFIGFSEVANYYTNLLKGFDELGTQYTFMTFGKNIRDYDGKDDENVDQKLLHFVVQNVNRNLVSKFIFYPLFFAVRLYLLIKYSLRCNVFIFSYNASFLWLYDLPLLKVLGKKIIFVYHGSDSRPPYISGNYVDNGFSLDQVKWLTEKLYKRNTFIEKYANAIVSLPASGQFFSRKMINFLWVGLPIDLKNHIMPFDKADNGPVKIVHAPSTKKAKGSAIFKRIIRELIDEGYNIDYLELFNVPNRVVLEELQKADILLDELYSDTTMAGLATEAAYFSIPCVVGGYYSDMQKDMHGMELPPSKYVKPDKIKGAIIELLKSREKREKLGNEAKKYVDKYWSPKSVAERFVMIINGLPLPKAAYYEQSEIMYFSGWGVSDSDLKKFLFNYINRFGSESLLLSHNQKLLDKVLSYV